MSKFRTWRDGAGTTAGLFPPFQIGKPQIEDTDDTRFLRIAKTTARTPPADVNSETYNCLASEGVLDYYSTVLLLSGERLSAATGM